MFEPHTDTIKNTSEKPTKILSESSNKNNQTIGNLNNKLLEIMNDRGNLAFYFMSPVSKIINLEITSQFKLVKYPNSNRVNDLLIHNTIPVTLYINLLRFRNAGKKLELKRELLNTIFNKDFNIHLASLSDKETLHDFANETYFDVKAPDNKST